MIGIVFQIRKKYKNLNNLASRSPYGMKYSSLELSYWDKSNDSKIKFLVSKYHKITHIKHVLKN
jgi:hypothetical protein